MPIPAPGLTAPSALPAAPQWELVTPDVAARWLEANVGNRTLTNRSVDRFAADMRNGLWQNTGDPIRFSISGRLIDGQHRLEAVVKSGVPTQFLVIRGLPDHAQDAMDQGRARTAGDVLSLHGERNAALVASAVKFYLMWRDGLLFKNSKLAAEITNSVIAAWVAENRKSIDVFQLATRVIRNNDASQQVAGAAFLIFERIDSQDAIEFFTLLCDGAGGAGHPITTLDKRLQRARREGSNLSKRDVLAMFIQAWNAWRDQRELNRFTRPRGGTWTPDDFPKAH